MAAAVVAAVMPGALVPLGVFVAVSLLSLVLLRPLVRRHVRLPTSSRTGTAALIGRKALVLARVDASGGRVKIGGEVWSARAFLEDEAMEAGQQVEVVEIDGATALVF